MQQQTETAFEENKKKHSTVGGILSWWHFFPVAFCPVAFCPDTAMNTRLRL